MQVEMAAKLLTLCRKSPFRPPYAKPGIGVYINK